MTVKAPSYNSLSAVVMVLIAARWSNQLLTQQWNGGQIPPFNTDLSEC